MKNFFWIFEYYLFRKDHFFTLFLVVLGLMFFSVTGFSREIHWIEIPDGANLKELINKEIERQDEKGLVIFYENAMTYYSVWRQEKQKDMEKWLNDFNKKEESL